MIELVTIVCANTFRHNKKKAHSILREDCSKSVTVGDITRTPTINECKSRDQQNEQQSIT